MILPKQKLSKFPGLPNWQWQCTVTADIFTANYLPTTAASFIYDGYKSAQLSIAAWIVSTLIRAVFRYLLYGTNYKTNPLQALYHFYKKSHKFQKVKTLAI